MMINDLEAAIMAANEFLARAENFCAAEKARARKTNARVVESGKQSASIKRASMELTRALADLRHPWREES